VIKLKTIVQKVVCGKNFFHMRTVYFASDVPPSK